MAGNRVEYVYYLKDMFTRNAGMMALAAQNISRYAKRAGMNVGQLAAIGGGGAMMLGGIKMMDRMVENYIRWDSVLTDVKKVVPASVKNFGAIENAIHRLSVKIPLVRKEMAMFMESGIRAGVSNLKNGSVEYIKGLANFAKLGAETAFMFNMSAGQSAMVLAKMKSSLHMDMKEMKGFMMQINLLGDTMATNESNIVEIVRRVAPLAQSLGAGNKVVEQRLRRDVAAIGAAMSASGVKDEIAGTGTRNFILRAGLGKHGVKDMRAGMKLIGLDAEKIAAGMRTNLLGTLKKVLVHINKLKKTADKNFAVAGIFGLRGVDAVAGLLGSVQLLEQAAALSKDIARQQERWKTGLAVKYASIESHRQRAQNSVAFLKNVMVSSWKDELIWFYDLVREISEYIQSHPWMAKMVGGITAFLIVGGGLLMTLGMLSMAFTALGIASLGAVLPVLGILFALGAVAYGVYELAQSWSSLSPSMRGLSAAMIVFGLGMLALLSPILAVVAGVLLLAYAASQIYQHWDGIKAYFADIWTSIKESISETFTWDNLKTGTVNFFKGVLSGWLNIGAQIKASIIDIFTFKMPAWMQSLGNWLSGKKQAVARQNSTLEQKLAASAQARNLAQTRDNYMKWPNDTAVRARANIAVESYNRLKAQMESTARNRAASTNRAIAASGMVIQGQKQRVEVQTFSNINSHVTVTAPPSIQLTLPNGTLAGRLNLGTKVKPGTNAANSFGETKE